MNDFEIINTAPKRTADRPLAGLTIMTVEDSRLASEVLRCLCLKSGARLRRADCVASARRHLAVYRPSAMIIDIGLPDGSGLDLVRELSRAEPRIPAIIATSGDDLAEASALEAGADAFMPKPIFGLAAFQQTILRYLPISSPDMSVRAVSSEIVKPDLTSLQEDLLHAQEVARSGETEGARLEYLTQFLASLGRAADDPHISATAIDLEGSCQEVFAARIGALARERLAL
ncbi:response regulator [Tropicimonas sp. IMCC34011]|uniref:response regulator n=1 Tax=Tropicimonas sp. IMCC34011 TaxID=2248759 RepID=UPI000E2595AC|nr:response regulator [Tropicimonas sp. IMCC34011]